MVRFCAIFYRKRLTDIQVHLSSVLLLGQNSHLDVPGAVLGKDVVAVTEWVVIGDVVKGLDGSNLELADSCVYTISKVTFEYLSTAHGAINTFLHTRSDVIILLYHGFLNVTLEDRHSLELLSM
jgi:hypothetical protein